MNRSRTVSRHAAARAGRAEAGGGKLRILFITLMYYPHVGGIESFLKFIAEKLAAMGYSITVLTGEPRVTAVRQEVINGVTVVRWPTWSPGGMYHIPRDIMAFRSYLRNSTKGYDVIHINSVHAFINTVALAALGRRPPRQRLVMSPHYISKPKPVARKILFEANALLLRALLRKVQAFIFASAYERLIFEEDFGLKGIGAITPLPLPDDVFRHEWNPPSDRVVVVMSGRMDIAQKRFDTFLRAIPLFLQELRCDGWDFPIKFKLIGTGRNEGELKAMAETLKIHDYIDFIRFLPREEYLRVISGATMYVLLSECENYGIAPREAIAMGVPTLVSCNSALAELVSYGLCIGVRHPSTPEEVAHTMTTALGTLRSASLKHRKGDLIRTWTSEYMLGRLLKIYKGISASGMGASGLPDWAAGDYRMGTEDGWAEEGRNSPSGGGGEGESENEGGGSGVGGGRDGGRDGDGDGDGGGWGHGGGSGRGWDNGLEDGGGRSYR